MEQKNKSSVHSYEKILNANEIILFVGAFLYGGVYLFSGEIPLAILTVVAISILVVVLRYLKKNDKADLAVSVIAYTQLAVVLIIGLLGGEVAGGFTLIIAVFMANALYYRPNMLIAQLVCLNIYLLGTLFFMGTLYVGISTDFLFRAIFGLDSAIVVLILLVKWGVASSEAVAKRELETQELLSQLNMRMAQSKESADNQQRIFEEIKRRSDNLFGASQRMLNVSQSISKASDEQSDIVDDLTSRSGSVVSEIKSAQQNAEKSRELAMSSAKKLEQNSMNMAEIVEAISEIERSSEKIISIIKSVEDIAFQTNILALNASIEAARAGSAGKGFAVVADEVRDLANKSSLAAKDSSVLVDTSVVNVKRGAALIKVAAQNISDVMVSSATTADNVNAISDVMVSQVQNVESILQQIQEFSFIINESARVAEENNNLASEVLSEVTSINKAINV